MAVAHAKYTGDDARPAAGASLVTVRAGVAESARWSWRVAGGLAALAAGALLAFVIAHWGWRAFGPTTAVAPPPATPEPWAPAISGAGLFGRAAGPAAGPAATAAVLSGDVRLLGVFAGRDGTGQALFRLPDRGPVLVTTGADIAKDVTLLAVRPDGVRIRDHGETRDIVLRVTPGAPAVPGGRGEPPAPAAKAGGVVGKAVPVRAACVAPGDFKGPVLRLNAELLTGLASQPDSWRTVLAPTASGLAVREENGFAAMLGMKSGDRVLQANGIALTGVDDLLTAVVRPLIASQQVRVSGMREGRPAEWLFLNAGACPG